MARTTNCPAEDRQLQPKAFAESLAKAALEKKGRDVVIIDVGDILVVTDYFLIVSGATDRQVKAIAEAVEAKAKAAGRRPYGVEGRREAVWVLLDFGDVVAHVFRQEERAYYELERLFKDAPQLELPEAAIP